MALELAGLMVGTVFLGAPAAVVVVADGDGFVVDPVTDDAFMGDALVGEVAAGLVVAAPEADGFGAGVLVADDTVGVPGVEDPTAEDLAVEDGDAAGIFLMAAACGFGVTLSVEGATEFGAEELGLGAPVLAWFAPVAAGRVAVRGFGTACDRVAPGAVGVALGDLASAAEFGVLNFGVLVFGALVFGLTIFCAAGWPGAGTSGFGGTVGRRSARMSTARMGVV